MQHYTFTHTDRRGVLTGIASFIASTPFSSVLCEAQTSPSNLPYPDAILMRALENAPWAVLSAATSKQPVVYALWDPTCGHCLDLIRDVAAKKHSQYEFRWIGGAARNAEQERLIAYIAKQRKFEGLTPELISAAKAATMPVEYIKRVNSAELIQISIASIKKPTGMRYPILACYNGKDLSVAFSYGPGKGIEQLPRAKRFSDAKPNLTYLTDTQTDLGPAEGTLPSSSTTYIIYSLPSTFSAPLYHVQPGQPLNIQARRRYRIGKEEWLQTSELFTMFHRKYGGYIRIA